MWRLVRSLARNLSPVHRLAERAVSRGDSARDRKDWVEAIYYYEQYLRVKPSAAAIWIQLGHARKESGDLYRADSAYRTALEFTPESSDLQLQIGHLRKLQGDDSQARTHYLRALELDPENKDALHELGAMQRPHQQDVRVAGRSSIGQDVRFELERQLPVLLEHISGAKALAFNVARQERRLDDAFQRIETVGRDLLGIGSSESKLEVLKGQIATLLEHASATRALAFEMKRQASYLEETKSSLGSYANRMDAICQDLRHANNALRDVDQIKVQLRALGDAQGVAELAHKNAAGVLEQRIGELQKLLHDQGTSLACIAHRVESVETTCQELSVLGSQQKESQLDFRVAVETNSQRIGELSAGLEAQRQSLETTTRTLHVNGAQIEALTATFENQRAVQQSREEELKMNVDSLIERERLGRNELSILRSLCQQGFADQDAQNSECARTMASQTAVSDRILKTFATKLADLEARIKGSRDSQEDLNSRIATMDTALAELRQYRQPSLEKDPYFMQLCEQYHAFEQQSHSTLSYLLGRVEFVRRELMFEFQFGGARSHRGQKPGSVRSEIKNVDKLTDAQARGDVRLNIGCGHLSLADYVNVDRRDLPGVDVVAEADDLPFEPRSVREIRSNHLVEHFPQEFLVRSVLPHWKSLLVPGGKLVAVVPDGQAMLEKQATGEFPFEEFREVLFGSQEYVGDFHFNLLTPQGLQQMLEDQGFREVRLLATARRNGLCFEFEIEACLPEATIGDWSSSGSPRSRRNHQDTRVEPSAHQDSQRNE